jgi:hypothetical protein
LVLRAWPPDGPSREHLERIHHWCFLMADLGFIPVPLHDNAGQSLREYEGRVWEVTPWLAGEADSSHPPAQAHLRSAFRGLAAVHEQLVCEQVEGVSPGLVQRRDAIKQLLEGGFELLEAAIERQPGSPADNASAAMRWLWLARTTAPLLLETLMRSSAQVIRLQPCLRDARPEHFLFEGDHLTGVVDFGAMGVDSVAGDLSRLIGEWLAGDSKICEEALKVYEHTRPLEPAETALIRVFRSSADLLIGERWVRWHYLENRRFEDPHAVSKGLARGLKRLEGLASELSRARSIDQKLC